jgi:hypothetical protein
MKTYRIVYLPTGREEARIEAKSVLAAKRKHGYRNWAFYLVEEV